MKNKILLILLALGLALAFFSCAEQTADSAPDIAGNEEEGTVVKFALSRPSIETSTSIEPMTKAGGENVARMTNTYYIYVLRKIGGNWIVDQMISEKLYKYKPKDVPDGEPTMPLLFEPAPEDIYDHTTNPSGIYMNTSNWEYFFLPEEYLGWDFELTLREGDYKVVTVINPTNCNAEKLKPGYSFTEADIPQILSYLRTGLETEYPITVKDPDNYSNLTAVYGDVYYGSSDTFHVPKSTSLAESDPAPQIQIASKRVTGRVRILIKDYNDNDPTISFAVGEREVAPDCSFYLEASGAKKFYTGVDILGNFVGEANILHGRLYTSITQWYTAPNGGNYMVTTDRGRYTSSSFFADPSDTEGIPALFGPLVVSRAQDDNFNCQYFGEDPFTFMGDRHNCFSFGISGDEKITKSTNPPFYIFYLLRPIDSATGLPEDVNGFFGPYAEYI